MDNFLIEKQHFSIGVQRYVFPFYNTNFFLFLIKLFVFCTKVNVKTFCFLKKNYLCLQVSEKLKMSNEKLQISIKRYLI